MTRLLAVAATALSTVAVVGGSDVAARIDSTGDPAEIVPGDAFTRSFDIAHNPERDEYFAVWNDLGPTGFAVLDVVGQRLDATGSPLGGPVVVAAQDVNGSGRMLQGTFAPPSVAYNASTDQYLVTFARGSTQASKPAANLRSAEVFGQLVSDQGATVGAEVSLNPIMGNFVFCIPRYPQVTADPGTGGYALIYNRIYGTTSSGGECGGLEPSTAVTVIQALSGSLVRGAMVDFPVTAGGWVSSEIGHNPVTGQLMVTQPYAGLKVGSDNRNGRRFPAQIYSSSLSTIGPLRVVDVDPYDPSSREATGPVNRVFPVADPVTGNWFTVATARFNGPAWTNLLSSSGESLRTGTKMFGGTPQAAAAVGDGTFVYSTNAGTVVQVRADGTEVHTVSPVSSTVVDTNAVAMSGNGTGAGVGIAEGSTVSYGFDVVAPGALPVPPARLLETRDGSEFTTIDGEFEGDGKVPDGEFVALDVAGRGGVPDDAGAVLLNIAAAGAASGGFVTAYPCDAAERPTTSNLNYSAGGAASAAAIAKVSVDGTVCLFTSASAHLIVDVNGYVPAGGSVTPVVPARLLETRDIAGSETVDDASEAIGARRSLQVTPLTVAGRGGVADDADAVLVNVTAINPSVRAFLTVYPCDEDRPTAANLNASAGGVVNNLVMAKVADDGTICVFTSADTDLVVDVAAYVPSGGGLLPVVPARLLESRSGAGNVTIDGQNQADGRIGADGVKTIPTHGRGGVDAAATGVMLNVAYIAPTTGGFMTAYPCDEERPTAANLNFAAGDVGSNAVFVKLSGSGTVCVYSTSVSDLAVDVVGYTVDKS